MYYTKRNYRNYRNNNMNKNYVQKSNMNNKTNVKNNTTKFKPNYTKVITLGMVLVLVTFILTSCQLQVKDTEDTKTYAIIMK